MSRSPRRVTVLFVALFSAIVVVGGIAASLLVDTTEPVDLLFGGGNGISTQGPGGPVGEGLDIVTDLANDYLEIAEPFKTFDLEFENPILTVAASGDADEAEGVTVRVGDTEVTVGGVLSQVPLAEIDALRQEIEDAGWRLLTPDDDAPVFVIDDEEHTYVAIFVHEDDRLVEVVVLQGPEYGGLRIVANPWIVEKSDAEGRLLDVRVRNPFHSISAAGLEGDDVVLERIHCVNGRCVPYKHIKPACDLVPQCTDPGTVRLGPKDVFAGGHHEFPGTLLHVWSADYFHGGAGLSLLDDDEVAFVAPYWEGNPFTAQGLHVHDDKGRAATVKILLPTTTEPRFALEISGPVVEGLDKDGAIGHEADLSGYRLQFDWGPLSVGTDTLYGNLDTLNGFLVGTWSDSDEQVVRAHIMPLLDPTPVLDIIATPMREVRLLVDPIHAEVVAKKAEIEVLAGGLVGTAGALVQPAERALVRVNALATGQADLVVSAAKGAAGCEDTLRGCLSLHIETVTETATGAVPPLPDPDATRAELEGTLAGVPLPDGSELDVYVNTVTGLVLGAIPDHACLDPTTGLPSGSPGCAGAPDVEDVAAAAVGFVVGTAGGLLFVPDPDSDILSVRDGDGNTLIEVGGGTLTIGGTETGFRDGHLVDLAVPGGPRICVDATFDPARLADGAFPSATIGCDGIGGRTLVVQPGATYETEGARLVGLTIHHPTDPGSYLFRYHDDGTTTTLATGVDGLGAHQVPSTMVQIAGNPVTSATWSLGLAGSTSASSGLFQEVTVAKQVYQDGRAVASGLPVGSELAVAFALIEGPESTIDVGSGDHVVSSADGRLAGAAWVSGLREQPFAVRAPMDQVSQSLNIVHRVGQAPRVGIDPAFPLSLSDYDDEGVHTYLGRLAADTVSDFQDGAELRFLLSWTDRYGPVAVTRVDDNGGLHYRYKLDNSAPVGRITTPAQSEHATFEVLWDADGPSGSGLDRFFVEVSEGATAGAGGWSAWIAGAAAEEPRSATFAGAPGTQYWFRAQACDKAGNCGPWSDARATQVAGAAEPDLPVPSLSVLAPAAGATLDGFVTLVWTVDYDGAATPVSTVQYRAVGASAWSPVYSGRGTEATWDTTRLTDGAYELRFLVSDGAQEQETLVPIVLENGNEGHTLERLRERVGAAPPIEGEPAGEDGKRAKKDTPAPGALLVVVSVVAVVAAWAGLRPRRP